MARTPKQSSQKPAGTPLREVQQEPGPTAQQKGNSPSPQARHNVPGCAQTTSGSEAVNQKQRKKSGQKQTSAAPAGARPNKNLPAPPTPTIAKKTINERNTAALESLAKKLEENSVIFRSLLSATTNKNRLMEEMRAEMRQNAEQARLESAKQHEELLSGIKEYNPHDAARVMNHHDGEEVTLEQQVKAGFNFVKLHTMIQMLDEDQGKELFDVTFGTVARPSHVLIKAAKFMIGGDVDDNEAKRFLQKKLPSSMRPKNGKIATFVEKAQGRAMDFVRTAFMKSFLDNLPSSSSLLCSSSVAESVENDVNDAPETEVMERTSSIEDERKQIEAQNMFDSGEFKWKEEFNVCWIQAWITARRTATMVMSNMFKKVQRFRKDFDFPPIPGKKTGAERKNISIFSFAVLRLKVSKHIQRLAEGDRAGMRSPHGPDWAREVVILADTLQRMTPNQSSESESDDNPSSFDECLPIVYAGLTIKRHLTNDEYQDMRKKAGFD